MTDKKNMTSLIKAAAIVIIIFGCLFIIWHIVPHFITKSRVEQAAKVARAKDLATVIVLKTLNNYLTGGTILFAYAVK